MLLSCVDATDCFPEQPWGWVGAASARGKGPAVACMETQSRTQYLIPGSWLTISVSYVNNCCEKKTIVLGRNWSKTAKLKRNRTVQWPPSCSVRDRTSWLYRISSIRFGVLRYGFVNTVKIALVQRSRTSLVFLSIGKFKFATLTSALESQYRQQTTRLWDSCLESIIQVTRCCVTWSQVKL